MQNGAGTQAPGAPPPGLRLAIALALAAGVFAIYAPVAGFEFVDFDDDTYVFENPVVAQGLSAEGLRFAFSKGEIQALHLPHPLTWLSHMLDVELFGLAAGRHHGTNVALHALAALLLFGALHALTGSTWRSAAAAALFAWHPLRVESVAWVAERKDVLSGVFAMATLWAYARCARRESLAAGLVTALCFALGLLAKPTLVPLPLVLLLLDRWPLARRRPFSYRVIEKLPLFALSAVSSGLTLVYQRGSLLALDELSLRERAASGVLAIAGYLRRLVWPSELAPLYPHPYLSTQGGVEPSGAAIAAAAALAVGITFAVLRARWQPALATGWLWFLVMLLPASGLVHVGRQALADRYTYLPMVGLALALAWGAGALAGRARARRRLVCAAVVLALVGYAWAARVQVGVWRNSETLFRHTLAVSPRASVIHFALAGWLRVHGRFDEATGHYQAALEQDPDNSTLHFDLGRALHAQGRSAEAIEQYRQAAALDPGDARAQLQLGLSLQLEGRLEPAIEHYRRAAELDPTDPKIRERLDAALAERAR